MNRLWAIVIKEFIEIRRDPRTLGLVVLMPILLLILFGFAITLDIRRIPTAVCDRDLTAPSRDLIRAFFATGYFQATAPQACGRETELLDGGIANVYLEIPADFGDRFSAGGSPAIQVLLDGSDNNTASVAAGYVEQVLRRFSTRNSIDDDSEAVRVVSRIWFNPDLDSTIFITPGIIGMLMMIIGVAIPAMAVVRERELGNLEVLLSTPVRPVEVILGKLLPYGIISLGVIILILLTGMVVFHVPFRGSTVHLFGQTLVFLLATLGMGLLISTIAKTRAVAYFISLLTTLLPTFILSGFIFPIESMPLPLQGVNFLIPSTHFLIILRAILLKGVGMGAVWPHTLILLSFALVVITIRSMMTALGIVKEKEIGTIEQLIVTPLRRSELMIGKLLPFVVIGFVDIGVVLLAGILWFEVPVRGSIPLLFALSAVYIMTTLGLGLFVSTISKTQNQAQITTFFLMFPMMILSGFAFPIANMPVFFQDLSYLSPVRYFLVIIRGIFLKGNGIETLWLQVVPLAVLAVLIFSLSVLRFRRTLG